MAMASGSPLLKIIGLGVAISALFIIFKVVTIDSDTSVEGGDRTPVVPTTPEDLDETPETIRTLSAQVTQLRSELKSLSIENKRLREQEESIKRDISASLENKIAEERKRQTTQTDNIFHKIAGRIDKIVEENTIKQPVPQAQPEAVPAKVEAPKEELVWVEPLVKPVSKPAKPEKVSATDQVAGTTDRQLPPVFQTGTGTVQGLAQPLTVQAQAVPTIPVHTIPENATLIDSTLMTALIGRVPFGGPLQEPFPFKVIIGAENLASNGIKIPRVVNMVVSAETIGDWTLSCVRGEIQSMTFTFEDGTIHTINSGGELGYISDPQGIPCISGKRISNATAFLLGRLVAAATSRVAGSFEQAETQQDASFFGIAKNVDQPGPHAAFSAAKDAANELQKYIGERQAQTFDVIFVPPASKVSIHITEEIPIDFNPKGRKVFHGNVNTSAIRAVID